MSSIASISGIFRGAPAVTPRSPTIVSVGMTVPPKDMFRLGGLATSFPLTARLGLRWGFWRRPVGTIYGVSHLPETIGPHLELLEARRKAGARSVALEMSPKKLKHPSRFEDSSNVFEMLAKRAIAMGMRVVPLESDEMRTERIIVNYGNMYLGADGEIRLYALKNDIHDLEARLKGVERKLPYLAPDELARLADISRVYQWLKMTRELLVEIDCDLDRFAQRWREVNVTRVNAEMREVILKERPDLVFVGDAHAKALLDIGGYRYVDLSDSFLPPLPVLNDSRYPKRSQETFAKFAQERGLFMASVAYRLFIPLAIEALGIGEEDSSFFAILDESLATEGEIPFLVLRSFYDENPLAKECLIPDPDRDIRYLKMPVAQARSRIKEALRKAQASFG